MKKITLLILALATLLGGSVKVSAQGKYGADSAQCVLYLSYYKEYFKQKAYDEATPNWRKAYKLCPVTASQNLLIDGTTLLRRLITKNASNATYKAALVDSLLTLHDQRAQNYPKYTITALNNKALDMANYIKDDNEKLYNGYESVIKSNDINVKVNILLLDLQAAIELYRQGTIGAETVIEAYQRNVELVEKLPTKNDMEVEQNEKVKTDMGNLFAASKVASCDNLIEIFTPRLAADPDNLDLATNIVKTMSMTEDCADNDLYLNAVTTMHKLNPSAQSAYYLYRLHSSKDDVDEAIKYMEEAIASDESEADKDADWTYELAVFCFKNGMNSKAFELASSITSIESLAGKAYFLIGNIWAGARCGGDEIAKRAPYWVACDYMNKAKAADPSLTEEANRYISQYSVYFPQSAEAFMYDVTNGQSYTVSCGGMRATTTVRTVK